LAAHRADAPGKAYNRLVIHEVRGVTRLRKLVALSRSERRVLLLVAALVMALRVMLLVVPVRTVRHLLARAVPAFLPRSASPEALVHAIRRVGAHVPGASCLVQALAVQALFQSRGLDARLCLGVGRNDDGRLVGHAWVECHGRTVIGEGLPERHTRLILDSQEPSTA
jgi:Transglutaminase-like superfamily